MSYIILRGRWYRIIIQNVHSPTEDKIVDVKGIFYDELECVFDKFFEYHTNILLRDFNAKMGKKSIFKPTVWIKSLLPLVGEVSANFCG
jgi:hypothetical protein